MYTPQSFTSPAVYLAAPQPHKSVLMVLMKVFFQNPRSALIRSRLSCYCLL